MDLSRAFLNTNGVTQHAKAKIAAAGSGSRITGDLIPECLRGNAAGGGVLRRTSQRLEVCSPERDCRSGSTRASARRRYPMPFAGKYQLTPEEAMVAKIPVIEGETDDATAMSYGYIPGISRWSPVPRRGLCRGGIPVQAGGSRRGSAVGAADLPGIF